VKALILVDIQNDFCPGGALAVPRGDEVVPVANRLAAAFPLVVATQDWHPPDHGSFAANHPGKKPYEIGALAGMPQVLWPVHCVQGSAGAAFHPDLDITRVGHVFPRGTDPAIDGYSGFYDTGKRKTTGLGDFLLARGVHEVVVAGLATDYCVRATALDAAALGFAVTMVEDGCRGMELGPGDVDRAIQDMRRSRVRLALSEDLV
jgi:nicotinamidase/pyrazinamidase